jgi:hypothetical protein
VPEGALVADAEQGSPADATPPPTGAAEGAGFVALPSCRFRSLADALDAAAARGSGAVVEAAGAFRTSLEPRPLAVPAGVTLRPRPGAAAALEVDAAGAAALRLAAGATVEDLVVRSADPAAAGDALAAACADGTPISLARVRVEHAEGAGRLAAGLRVSAPCAVQAADLAVSGARTGVVADGGAVALVRARVEGCEAEGVTATSAEATISDSRIARNGDGGLVLQFSRKVDLQRNVICGNGATTARVPSVTDRLGALVLVDEPPPAVVFEANRVFGNAGDQVLVVGSASGWDLTGAADLSGCQDLANYLAGYSGTWRGLFAARATVDARFNAWASAIPSAGRDYEASNGTVEAGGTTESCGAPPSPLPTCD